MSRNLFQSVALGDLTLQNRIVMAPMTRSRAPGNVPNALMAEYYGQRAGAGLIITEGTSPSPEGLGYARIPGLFTDEQVQGWCAVATAVHAGGAKLFVQLMHTGRIAHPLNLPAGQSTLAPSAIAAAGQIWTDQAGLQDHATPREMDPADLQRVRGDFVRAAQLARSAGMDGVELHAANGYLLGQFLNPRSNQRSDAYGGSPENRRRYLLEVVDAVVATIGADRVGLRLSPFNPFNDLAASFPGEEAELLALVAELAQRNLAYLHLIAAPAAVPEATVQAVRTVFPGSLILNGGFDRERAETALASGLADLVAFGRPFISNPDLPRRLRADLPLADMDPGTLYTPGAAGYSDYPVLEAAAMPA